MQDLRKMLEDSNDPFSIFADKMALSHHTVKEVLELADEFLNDVEKGKLLSLEHFQSLSSAVKVQMIKRISDDKIKLQLLNNPEIAADFPSFSIIDMIHSLGEKSKIELLQDTSFMKAHRLESYQIVDLIISLSDASKQEILSNNELLMQQLQIQEHEIDKVIASLSSEELKLQMIDQFQLRKDRVISILKTFSDESKQRIVCNNEYELNVFALEEIVASLSTDALVQFLQNQQELIEKNGMKFFRITEQLTSKNQLAFFSHMEETGLSLSEKRKILASFHQNTKTQIDLSHLPPEYMTAIQMQKSERLDRRHEYGKITVDLTGDLEQYQGLDELLYVNPLDISAEERQKLLQLCDICPHIQLKDDLIVGISTAEEYKNAEAWIDSLLQEIDPDWTDIQKVAFIDHAIGKKISYSPDFDTEVEKIADARALWKIIDSGYGVCNGIAQVEKYILNRVNIEAELVSSGRHAFLKLVDIEMPTSNGEKVRGDTVLDPTWNLTAHRYGATPDSFCKSYSEIRKSDMRSDGIDAGCHRNDKELESATLNLDEHSLRQVFASIGIADREGNFPIKGLLEQSRAIDQEQLPNQEALEKQLALITKYDPDFATSQNSTMSILHNILQYQKNLKMNRCVIHRVYQRDDEDKQPVVYLYVDLPEVGNQFYYADGNSQQFLAMPQKEFETKFECYAEDMKRDQGRRPWEIKEKVTEKEDLTRSSGKVVADKGER